MEYDDIETELAALLRDAGIRYFSAREFLTLGPSHYNKRSPGFAKNTLPAPSALPNIIPTALALDAARHDLGSPVVVNSAWRSDRYNRAVGGAPQSFHKTFLAADTAPANPALLGRYYRILRGLRDGGEWRGGLGGYKTFVHVDTGTSYNRDWGVQL